MKLSVIIVTYQRPEALKKCLKSLINCMDRSKNECEVIVVDGDKNKTALDVCNKFNNIAYIHNPNGYGRMTGSRNLGLLAAKGNIVAYIDDDAYVREGFIDNLVKHYDNPNIEAVGGRAINIPHIEEKKYPDVPIGKINNSCMIIGNFDAKIDHPICVDHIIGCNMSFRKNVITQLGGFHEYYPGFCSTYEEADLCIRIKKSGYNILLEPNSIVDHEGAPRKVGTRFNIPYIFRVNRNHATLVVRNKGVFSLSLLNILHTQYTRGVFTGYSRINTTFISEDFRYSYWHNRRYSSQIFSAK